MTRRVAVSPSKPSFSRASLRSIRRRSVRIGVPLIAVSTLGKNGGREWRGQSDAWKFFERNFRMLFQGQGVHIFFGNEEQYFMAALAKHFRHGQAGKQMSASSTACNDCVHLGFKFEA